MNRRLRPALVCAGLLALAGPACAENLSQTVPQSAALGTGPYKAVMEPAPGLPTHTAYRPADLQAVRVPMPIVVWGNGACANDGNRFRWFLSEIASHGYLIAAIGPIRAPDVELWRPEPQPATPAAAAPAPAALPPPATHTAQLIQAMDWAIAENSRPGSPYFHKLDPGKIAVMGMSCGGAQAIEASADPRVSTSVMWNSGLFPGETTMGGGKALTKDDLKLFHAPLAYISGDASDIAYINANDDYGRLDRIPAMRLWRKGTPHSGTYGEANGGDFGRVAVAWLDWRLKGDARAGAMFTGADCGLCRDPNWVVQRKNWP